LLKNNQERLQKVFESHLKHSQKFLALHADKKGSMITDEEKIMQECSELSNQLCHLTEPINGRHHEDFLPRLLVIIDTILQLNHQ
ncbi:551_t:CDS:1, partial [Funneliformis geosporum]